MPEERRTTLISAGAALVLAAGLTALFAVLLINRHLDRSFITYRYAHNLSAGAGFVYNPGEPLLSDAVAPLYAILLSLGTRLTPDIPLLGNLIGIAAIALGSLALYGVVYSGESKLAAPVAAGIYAGFPLLWMTLGLETALWMALGLTAVWLHRREWGPGAALILALATFIRPETGVLVIVLIADALASGRPTRLLPAGIYAAVVAVEVMWGLSAFESGGPLPGLPPAQMAGILPDIIAPDVFGGVAALAGALFTLAPLWGIVGLLIVPGLFSLKTHRGALVLVIWAALHLASLGILRTAMSAWSFVPLIPALAALVSLGFGWLVCRVKQVHLRLAIGCLAALPIAGAVAQSYVNLVLDTPGQIDAWRAVTPAPVARNDVEAGTWLGDNTAPDTRIGMSHVGVAAYLADRFIFDYRGTLQPDLAQAVRRGDGQWWLGTYAPGYVVLRASEAESLDGYAPATDSWFASHYAETARFDAAPGAEEAVLIFARSADPLPLQDTLVGMVTYANGLTVNGIATDFSLDPLETGRAARLRLEWLLESPVEIPQYVAIRIQSRAGNVAALAGQTLDFSRWPVRRLITTYHTIELAPGLPPGVYDLEVGIGPDPFALTWKPLVQAKVPFKNETFVGGVSGTRADFGDIALLGYRLVRTEENLDVSLMWQAAVTPRVDYLIVIQVRDARGAIVTQREAQPHEGTYPTSIWSAGEQVPDTYQLDIGGLPPGDYQVYAGLVGPDGSRLLTLDGQEAVLVGYLNILEQNGAP
jgi:hypothetical protein